MKFKLFIFVACCTLLLGASKSCENECEKAKKAQAELCTVGNLTSEACQASTALVVKICGSSPSPSPSPVPTPTPPVMQGSKCVDINQPCNCIDFPPPSGQATCVVCDMFSPGGVKNIGVVPICPPVPVPTPTPTPSTKCSFPQGVEDQLKEVPNPKTLASQLDQIISQHTGCAINSDCVLGQSDPQYYYAAMITWVQAAGLCAGQHNDGHTDEISINTTCNAGTTWENYHSVNYGDPRKVSWSGGGARSGWIAPISCGLTPPTPIPTPRPTPTPTPPSSSCIPMTQFGDGDQQLVLRDNGGAYLVDATPKVKNAAYCAPINGQLVCPLGPEGSTQRANCETWNGPYTWTYVNSGSNFFNNNGNPLQIKIPKPTPGGLVTVTSRLGVQGFIQVPGN